jgi:arabinogalactan endo-1,4-beta-galactosidase
MPQVSRVPRVSRRTLLAAAGVVPLSGLAGHGSAPQIRGADISFTLQEEAAGAVYRLDGHAAPLERILRRAGANWVRLRIWVDPPAGYSDLGQALRLAERAKRAGMQVLIDLHYADFWADPGKQPIPAAWQGQDLAALTRTVRDYTADVVAAFARRRIPIDMVQIGNEVIAGMLWPIGQLYGTGTERWPEFTTLVKAGVAGARVANPRGHRLRTMLHIDRGGDNGGSRYFFDHVLAQGVQFDVIGESFYPFWHGPMSALRANLADLATRYGKPIVVVETAYPWTVADGDDLANSVSDPATLPDGELYPPTPAGQAAYFTALRKLLHEVPGGLGLGFMDWEPEWIPGVGWEPGAGNPNDNLTMFDFAGNALPSVHAAFKP